MSGNPNHAGKLVVVDVGAAGGLQQPWAGVEEHVVAVMFEPNPVMAAELRQQKTKFSEVIVIESGLSDHVGQETLHITMSEGCCSLLTPNDDFLGIYTVAPAFRIRHDVPVAVTTYQTLYRAGRVPKPDLVKIDVQGLEYEVLTGFGDLLDACMAVQLEAHVYPIYRGQKLLGELVALLAERGLVLRKLVPVNHFDGDAVEFDAWFSLRHDRLAGLDEIGRWKLGMIHREWGLPLQTRQFAPNSWGTL